MKKIVFLILLLCFFSVFFYGIIYYSAKKELSDEKALSIVTTIFPLYDIAKSVGGEYADVSLLLPPGVEPHSFEPKPSDIFNISNADIFIYMGEVMEPWAEDVRKNIQTSVSIVNTGSEANFAFRSAPTGYIEPSAQRDHNNDGKSGVDPHVWLDFSNASKIVSAVEKAFVERDAAHAYVYRNNALEYQKKLEMLDDEYRRVLALCKTKRIVYGGHYAFGYLANRYNLTYSAAQGIAPDAEPSIKDIVDLTNQIRQEKIGAIFYEELSSPKIAEIIAEETNVRMYLLNAAHNVSKEDIERNVSFFSIMRENLNNLQAGLECSA